MQTNTTTRPAHRLPSDASIRRRNGYYFAARQQAFTDHERGEDNWLATRPNPEYMPVDAYAHDLGYMEGLEQAPAREASRKRATEALHRLNTRAAEYHARQQ